MSLYLHYLKSFQQSSNPEKSVFLIKDTAGVIWSPSPVGGVISPLCILQSCGCLPEVYVMYEMYVNKE